MLICAHCCSLVWQRTSWTKASSIFHTWDESTQNNNVLRSSITDTHTHTHTLVQKERRENCFLIEKRFCWYRGRAVQIIFKTKINSSPLLNVRHSNFHYSSKALCIRISTRLCTLKLIKKLFKVSKCSWCGSHKFVFFFSFHSTSFSALKNVYIQSCEEILSEVVGVWSRDNRFTFP